MATIDALRNLLYERDGGLCGICGAPVERYSMTVDHIEPRSKGGPDRVDNLRTAHRRCNIRRGPGRVFEDWSALPTHRPAYRSPGAEVTRVAQWRERRALTQQELADKIGITRVALARIEAGLAQPRPKTIRALAKALVVRLDDLMEPLNGED